MNAKDNLVFQQVKTWFKGRPECFERLRRIVNEETAMSMRVIDWFSANYSKSNATCYGLPDGREFIVWVEYKKVLDGGITKTLFDPFRRGGKQMSWSPDPATVEPINTSVGQLNFFRWAFENGVIDYIEKNYVAIKDDCDKRVLHPDTNTTVRNVRRPRRELSVSAMKYVTKHHVNVVVKFA